VNRDWLACRTPDHLRRAGLLGALLAAAVMAGCGSTRPNGLPSGPATTGSASSSASSVASQQSVSTVEATSTAVTTAVTVPVGQFPIVVTPPTPPGSGLFLTGVTATLRVVDPARGCVYLEVDNSSLMLPYWGAGTKALLGPPRLQLPDGTTVADGDSRLFRGGSLDVQRMPHVQQTLQNAGVDTACLEGVPSIFIVQFDLENIDPPGP